MHRRAATPVWAAARTLASRSAYSVRTRTFHSNTTGCDSARETSAKSSTRTKLTGEASVPRPHLPSKHNNTQGSNARLRRHQPSETPSERTQARGHTQANKTLHSQPSGNHAVNTTTSGQSNNGQNHANNAHKKRIREHPVKINSELAREVDSVVGEFAAGNIFGQVPAELALGAIARSDNNRADYALADVVSSYYTTMATSSNGGEDLSYTNYLTRTYTTKEDFEVPTRIAKESKGIRHKYDQGTNHVTTETSFLGLPIHSRYREIMSSIANNPVTIIAAETGSGKTTQVPRYIVETHLSNLKRMREGDRSRPFGSTSSAPSPRVLVTQPRRLAAITLANTIARSMGEFPGETVGYSVKQEELLPSNKDAQILFSTSGTVIARIAGAFDVSGPTHIIIDEVHERDTETEILLSVCKQMLATNPELRIILMSATANTQYLQEYFYGFGPTGVDGDSPSPLVIDVPGQQYNVDSVFLDDIMETPMKIWLSNTQKHTKGKSGASKHSDFLPSEPTKKWLEKIHIHKQPLSNKDFTIPYDLMTYVLSNICDSTPTNEAILVFLPGLKEIMQFYSMLLMQGGSMTETNDFNDSKKFNVHLLHSNLSLNRQRRAVKEETRSGVRKIILSTTIAETSITIPDVVHVLDSGLRRYNIFDPSQNCSFLVTRYASKSSLKQRKGRAGRVRPGKYYSMIPQWLMEQTDEVREVSKISANQNNSIMDLESIELSKQMLTADEPADIQQRDVTNLILQLLTSRPLHEVLRLMAQTPSPPSNEQITHAVKSLSRYNLLTMDPQNASKNSSEHQNWETTNEAISNIEMVGLNDVGKLLISLSVPPWVLTACMQGSRFGLIDEILKISILSDDTLLTNQLAEKLDKERTSIFLSRSEKVGDLSYYGSNKTLLKYNPDYIVPKKDSKDDDRLGLIETMLKNSSGGTGKVSYPYFLQIMGAPSDITAALVAFNGYIAAYDKAEYCNTYHLSKKYLSSLERNYNVLRDRLFIAGRFKGAERLRDMEQIWEKEMNNPSSTGNEHSQQYQNTQKQFNDGGSSESVKEVEDYHTDSQYVVKYNPLTRRTTGYTRRNVNDIIQERQQSKSVEYDETSVETENSNFNIARAEKEDVNLLKNYTTDFKETLLENVDNKFANEKHRTESHEVKKRSHASQFNGSLMGTNREILLRSIVSAQMFPNWAYLVAINPSNGDPSSIDNQPYIYRRFISSPAKINRGESNYRLTGATNELPPTKDVVITPQSTLGAPWLKQKSQKPPNYVCFTYLSKENENDNNGIMRNVSKANPLSLLFFTELPAVKLRDGKTISILISDSVLTSDKKGKLSKNAVLKEMEATNNIISRSGMSKNKSKFSVATLGKKNNRINSGKKHHELENASVSDLIYDSIYQVYTKMNRDTGRRGGDEILIRFDTKEDTDRILELARLARRHFKHYIHRVMDRATMDSEGLDDENTVDGAKRLAQEFKKYFKISSIDFADPNSLDEKAKESKTTIVSDNNEQLDSGEIDDKKLYKEDETKFRKVNFTYNEKQNPILKSAQEIPRNVDGTANIHDGLGNIPNESREATLGTSNKSDLSNYESTSLASNEIPNTETELDDSYDGIKRKHNADMKRVTEPSGTSSESDAPSNTPGRPYTNAVPGFTVNRSKRISNTITRLETNHITNSGKSSSTSGQTETLDISQEIKLLDILAKTLVDAER